jgi:uncharacterized membrane protein
MIRILVAYVATLVAFCIGDFVWLGTVAAGFYRSEIGPLLLAAPNWPAAGAFYALYAAGTVTFAVMPALRAAAWTRALLYGTLFGFFAYATYDLTNLATLKGWSLSLSVVDIAWGMAVTGMAATVGYLGARVAAA